jgi:O-succinylbenzoic acid--CoA ligase
MPLRPLAIEPGPDALRALPVLRSALEGGPAVLPYAAGGRPAEVPAGAMPDAGTALVVATSGSTGTPKLAMLSATALAASAAATHERLGGPGSWLLAMPPHHIAGIQVLLRCITAGTRPSVLDLSGGFAPEALAAAATALAGDRRYTALVPTQLARALAHRDATAALAALDAVLVGGAATPSRLLGEARAAGIRAVTTYGMSETSGGCVYDGVPLRGSVVRVDDAQRIHLGGATLASGYLGRPDLTAAAFALDAQGTRWFRTDDAGHLDGSGHWHVDGRLDDLINTGGLKVAPRIVEEALAGLDGVAEAVVVGSPDEEWGEVVSAALVLGDGAPERTVTQVRAALHGILPDHALPRRVVTVESLPLRGPGKPDRAEIRTLFASRGVTP